MIDHLLEDRILISPVLVGPSVTIGTLEGDVDSERRGELPVSAWLAADRTYEHPDEQAAGDELYQALRAASPHIRAAELDELIRALKTRAVQASPAAREGLESALQFLTKRRSALEDSS